MLDTLTSCWRNKRHKLRLGVVSLKGGLKRNIDYGLVLKNSDRGPQLQTIPLSSEIEPPYHIEFLNGLSSVVSREFNSDTFMLRRSAESLGISGKPKTTFKIPLLVEGEYKFPPGIMMHYAIALENVVLAQRSNYIIVNGSRMIDLPFVNGGKCVLGNHGNPRVCGATHNQNSLTGKKKLRVILEKGSLIVGGKGSSLGMTVYTNDKFFRGIWQLRKT